MSQSFEALRAALHRSIRRTDLKLAVHRTLPELRVSRGEHRITILLLPEGPILMNVESPGKRMQLSDSGPLSAADVDPWAARLAHFIVRQLQE